MSKKNAMIRTAAAAAATVLMSVGAMGVALADQDGSRGGDDAAATGAKADKGRQGPKADKGRQGPKEAKGAQSKGEQGQGDERGNGHTPVTVCHLLGNGGYHELTFDDNALEAHVNHGDIYPVPADGCPTDSEDVRPQTYRGTPGHVRVTVCHVLGNGGYHELTFDEHALRAHEAHGDLYPVPAEGCPAETSGETVPGTTPEGDDAAGDDTAADDSTTTAENEAATTTTEDEAATTTTEDDAAVAGVEELATTTSTQPRGAQVLGVEAVAGANRAAPVTGPLAGILPQTGAGQLGLAAAAGLLLVGAGATLVARRRAQTV
jgi:LPXTG-motif cell wall-anchored protein